MLVNISYKEHLGHLQLVASDCKVQSSSVNWDIGRVKINDFHYYGILVPMNWDIGIQLIYFDIINHDYFGFLCRRNDWNILELHP